jgi:hypothetical protein
MNCNFRLKVITQFFYRYLYMRANFQAGCYITGVARKVQSLRFCMEKACITWGKLRYSPALRRPKMHLILTERVAQLHEGPNEPE